MRGSFISLMGRRSTAGRTPKHWAVLDLGTDRIKALVVQRAGRDNVVIGAGTAPYAPHVSRDHCVPVDVAAMVQGCDRALREAEAMTERCGGTRVVPDWVVVCVPNCATVARSHQVTHQRSSDGAKVRKRDLEDALRRAQRLALRQLEGSISPRLGDPGTAIELLETSLTSVGIDGHRVTSPLGLHGAKLTVVVFNVVASGSYVKIVESVAEQLGLGLSAVVSTWRSLASAVREREAICLDVGGKATDVMLVRGGRAWATASLPFGGEDFTMIIADAFHLSRADAERLKTAYSLGQSEPRVKAQVQASLAELLHEWVKEVDRCLMELCGPDEPPRRFRLCGGGSLLPDISHALRSHQWSPRLGFPHQPEIAPLRPSEIPGILDRTGLLRDQQHVCAMSASSSAIGRGGDAAAWEPFLWSVKRPPSFGARGGRS